jgi:hypothetical protein
VTPLQREARRRGIKAPAPATLRKYGLVEEEWLALLAGQGWKCPICQRGASTLTLNTDHRHIPGWGKKPPEERKRYVRGVLCAWCNHRRVHSEMGAVEAQRIADYFKAFEARLRLAN